MNFIVSTGKAPTITVNPGGPGKWVAPAPGARRDVYAIGYEGGETLLLVADDAGKLQWLKSDFYSVLRG